MKARLKRRRLERSPLGCNADVMVAGRSRSVWCASGAGMVLGVWLVCALGGCTGPGLEPPFNRDLSTNQSGGSVVGSGTGGTASEASGGSVIVGPSGGSTAAGGNTASGGSLSSTGGIMSAGTGGSTGTLGDAGAVAGQDGSMKDAGVGDAATSDAATGQQ